MGTCTVCCEDYNQSTRLLVKCNHCNYEVCASCASTYLCDTPEYAHCMNCKKGWDRGFMYSNISKAFVRVKYKKAREKHLFDREMSMMPATQAEVEVIKYQKKQQRKMNEISEEILARKRELRGVYPVDVQSKKAAIALEVEIYMLSKKIELCRFKMNSGGHGTATPKKAFIRKCGNGECRGFLSTQWKCGICEKYTCKDCLEVKHDPDTHVCDPSNVETAKLLSHDSKPCPSCGAVIFKIEGCDQMYCVMCNTPFSWRTGMVVTGRIHNPHYYEYLRTHGGGGAVREIGDVPCGGLPNRSELPRVPSTCYDDAMGAYRLCLHIQNDTMYTLTAKDTRQYRIAYLMNELSEPEFKKCIQRIEKANAKKTEYRLLYTTFCDVVTDLFRNLTKADDYYRLVSELHSLVQYINQQFSVVADIFDCKAPKIYVPGWTLYPPLLPGTRT